MNSSDDELTVYTISDKGYLPGVVGLVNSFRHHGFHEEICIGALDRMTRDLNGENLETVDLETEVGDFPSNYKAELVCTHASGRFLFLDADIVVADDTFIPRLNDWIDAAPVFAAEAIIPETDHRRKMWREVGNEKEVPSSPIYYNAGMFGGLWERDRDLFEKWAELNRTVLESDAWHFSNVDFPMADQDTLNAVLQGLDRDELISIAPPDWWSAAAPHNSFLHVGGFPDGPAFLHCTTSQKPWLLDEIPLRGPNAYEERWWSSVQGDSRWISYEVSVPSWLERWLDGHWMVRTSNKVRRFGKRLLP
jgi:hypothetical protein